MFINVIYKDPAELSLYRRKSSLLDVDGAVEKQLLVNPCCPVRIMLEYIRKKCKLAEFTQFDLCDENGNLKGLFSLATYAYASQLFEHKRTYYLIVLHNETDKLITVLPQVARENKLYMELQTRVKRFMVSGETSPPQAAGTSSAAGGKATPVAKSKKK